MKRSFKIMMAFLLFVFLISCNSKQKEKEDEGKKGDVESNIKYADIDPFTLTGINETKSSPGYPFIKIEDIGNKRKIVYQFSGADSTVRIYEKVMGNWFTSHAGPADTGYIKRYEFISQDKIIELVYRHSLLQSASEMKNDEIVSYSYKDDIGINVKPLANALDSIKEKATIIITDKKELNGDILMITTAVFDKTNNKITYTDTTCLSGGMRSWYWFRHFSGKLIPCNN